MTFSVLSIIVEDAPEPRRVVGFGFDSGFTANSCLNRCKHTQKKLVTDVSTADKFLI